MCDSSKYRCHFLTGYVWPFKKQSRFRPLRARGVGRIRYAPRIGYVQFFEIPMRFLNWVLMLLQKTVLFSSPSRPRGGAYLICPYDRVPVPLQNTDAIPQPGTCEGSKNRSVFVPFEAAVWGVCNTPLQLATCNPLKYRCDLSIGGAGVFGRWGVGVTVCGGDGRG